MELSKNDLLDDIIKSDRMSELSKAFENSKNITDVNLTRTERRRAEKEKEKAKKTYNMTAESLARSLEEARKDERQHMSNFMVSYYSAAVSLILYDKWDFDKDKLSEAIEQINNIYDSLLEGYLDINDVKNTLLEELGIEV